jgi:hypothetical protein
MNKLTPIIPSELGVMKQVRVCRRDNVTRACSIRHCSTRCVRCCIPTLHSAPTQPLYRCAIDCVVAAPCHRHHHQAMLGTPAQYLNELSKSSDRSPDIKPKIKNKGFWAR